MSDDDKATIPRRRVIGWRERVSLPELGIQRISAKIDSGARTSALHAVDVEAFHQDGIEWVSFTVPSGDGTESRCSLPMADARPVKNTSGVWTSRFFIETRLILGDRSWPIEISLTDREQMGFDLILGRTAVRGHGLMIDPDRSMLAGPPKHGTIRPAPKSGAQNGPRA